MPPQGLRGPRRSWRASWLEPRPLPAPAALGGDGGFGLRLQEGRGQLGLPPWYLDTSHTGISRRPRCPDAGRSPFALGGPALLSPRWGFRARSQHWAWGRHGHTRDTGIRRCSRAEAAEDDPACAGLSLSVRRQQWWQATFGAYRVLGTVLGSHSFVTKHHDVGATISLLLEAKERLREVKRRPQGHTASKGWVWDLNLGNPALEKLQRCPP